MPGQTGLDAVREIRPDDMPATIFVTACDQCAIMDFDVHTNFQEVDQRMGISP